MNSREMILWLYRLGGHASPTEDGDWLVACKGRVFRRERLVDALQAFADAEGYLGGFQNVRSAAEDSRL